MFLSPFFLDCQRTALTDFYSTLVFDFIQAPAKRIRRAFLPHPPARRIQNPSRFETRAEAKQILFLSQK